MRILAFAVLAAVFTFGATLAASQHGGYRAALHNAFDSAAARHAR